MEWCTCIRHASNSLCLSCPTRLEHDFIARKTYFCYLLYALVINRPRSSPSPATDVGHDIHDSCSIVQQNPPCPFAVIVFCNVSLWSLTYKKIILE